jgi:hypothetical protein
MAKYATSSAETAAPETAAFGAAFKAFMDAMVAQATPPESPLLSRIRAHVGDDPATLPVIAEEFDAFEHPNVQVAFDALLAEEGRSVTLVGVAAENKRFVALRARHVIKASFQSNSRRGSRE